VVITIMRGEVRARLAELPAESVHMVVTSPPYYVTGLRQRAANLGRRCGVRS
jgi:DNA modification methylase